MSAHHSDQRGSSAFNSDQRGSSTFNGLVIFCKICGFSGFRCRDVVNHLASEDWSILTCGVDGCTREFSSLRSFKSHLSNYHPDFYPDIRYEVPDLENSTVFSSSPSVEQTPNNTAIDLPVSEIPDIDPTERFLLKIIQSLPSMRTLTFKLKMPPETSLKY